MNNAASRGASLALLLFGAVVATTGPAYARRTPTNAPSPTPTATPVYFPMSQPTPAPGATRSPIAAAEAGLMASAACQNDAFLGLRAVPMPYQGNVSVCGVATGPAAGGTLMVSIDGIAPIPVKAPGGVNVRPGDAVLIRGTYHRNKSGAEGIDAAGAGALSVIVPAASPPPGG